MWRKPSEALRLRVLGVEASRALSGGLPTNDPVVLCARIYAPQGDGDLDNFVTGICDALMAAHPRTPTDPVVWSDVPAAAKHYQAIAFKDDACVWRVDVERRSPPTSGPCYEIELRWDEHPAQSPTPPAYRSLPSHAVPRRRPRLAAASRLACPSAHARRSISRRQPGAGGRPGMRPRMGRRVINSPRSGRGAAR